MQHVPVSLGSVTPLTQSTRFCSESETSLPVCFACCPSIETTVEKAQHEPHEPWFLTGATRFFARQSTASGAAAPESACWRLVCGSLPGVRPFMRELNSDGVRSANSLRR